MAGTSKNSLPKQTAIPSLSPTKLNLLQIDKNSNKNFVLENVPSVDEVQAAISVLTQLFSTGETNTYENGTSSLNKELIEKMCISNGDSKKVEFTEEESENPLPSLVKKANNNESFSVLHSPGLQIVRKAISLMQLNPNIQKMVMSLSSDKALWEAVTKNKAVQELKTSFLSDGFNSSKSIKKMKPAEPLYLPGWSQTKSAHEESDIAAKILWFISDVLKHKLVALVSKIMQLVNELLFGSTGRKIQTMEILNDMLGSTIMLTLIVLLVVVFSRIQDKDQ